MIGLTGLTRGQKLESDVCLQARLNELTVITVLSVNVPFSCIHVRSWGCAFAPPTTTLLQTYPSKASYCLSVWVLRKISACVPMRCAWCIIPLKGEIYLYAHHIYYDLKPTERVAFSLELTGEGTEKISCSLLFRRPSSPLLPAHPIHKLLQMRTQREGTTASVTLQLLCELLFWLLPGLL